MTAGDAPDEQDRAPEGDPLGDLPDDTVISSRRRADDVPDEATAISSRRGAGDVPDDATAISSRRGAGDVPDDTVISSRRSSPEADVVDDTAPSVRSRAAPGEALDPLPAPSAPADTTPEEDTVLRPRAQTRETSASAEPAILRAAYVPDPASLRDPSRPRAVQPVTTVRVPASHRPPAVGVADPALGHESVDRAARARSRRRVLIVVLCTAAGAAAATVALVLLLT